jgi:hypothetical protein
MSDETRDSDTAAGGGGPAGTPTVPTPGADFLEPHESLKYVGRLFKGLSVVVILLILSEIGLGLYQDGFEALPLLLLEVAQLLIFAGLLWGAGDLTYLIVETNHDVRAARVHLWQLNMMRKMEMAERGVQVDPVDTEEPLG